MSHALQTSQLSASSLVVDRFKLGRMATTPVAIYRIGVLKGDLLHVRNPDVAIYQDPAQTEICVQPQSANATPGISCWTTQNAAANQAASMTVRRGGSVAGLVWELPAGSTYDDSVLRLWQPRSDKWYWSPTRNMLGSVFIVALRTVNAQFR
jgi:hypothetical protein